MSEAEILETLRNKQLSNIVELQKRNTIVQNSIFKLLGENYEKTILLDVILKKIIKNEAFDNELLINLFKNKYTSIDELNNIINS